jgi:hypothetical protein
MMNILVCLGGPASLTGRLGQNDRRAIAAARALAGDSQVTAMLAGSKDEGRALEAALGAGADRAVRIAVDGLASADFHTLGQILARAAQSLGAELVLTGARADTEALGALSASIARHMGFPHLANVEELARLPDEERPQGFAAALAATVRGGGRKRRLAVALPVVMSIAGGGDHLLADAGGAAPDRSGAIEVLSRADPEATVLRRRTEILGMSEALARANRTGDTATARLAGLKSP